MDEFKEMHKVAQAFARVFQGKDGKRALDHLRERFHVKGTTLFQDEAGRLDPAMVAAREGQRSVVLYIQDLVATDFRSAEELIAEFERSAKVEESIGV